MSGRHWQFSMALAVAAALFSTLAAAQADDGKAPAELAIAPAADQASDPAPAPPPSQAGESQQSPFQPEPEDAPTPDEAYASPRPAPPQLFSAREVQPSELDETGASGTAMCSDPSEPVGKDICRPADSRAGRRRLMGINFGGWVDQGITFNGRRPPDGFNGPVTFNDRDSEYQMNQFVAHAERVTNTQGCGWDIGGRVDALLGTDHRFVSTVGLDDQWNAGRFYGTALPQMYADVAYNDLTVRMGHFYSIVGYESAAAPANFFYSHSYAKQYGEPFTHTGLLGSCRVGERLTVAAGFDQGWNLWEDNNHKLELLAQAIWTTRDGRTSLAFALTSGAFDDAGQHNRTMYSIVLCRKITNRLQYVLQHDLGIDDDGGVALATGGHADAQWYGINQYLLYQVGERWAAGARIEWFRDNDGTRVGGIGAPHGWTLGPDIPQNQIGWVGNFYELTLGLNWTPYPHVVLRPECRWDWYDGNRDAQQRLPFHFGSRSDQFTVAVDLIVSY